MNFAVLAVLLALQSPATVGREATQTPRQRYDALVKDYAAAVEAWSKIYDQTNQKPDPTFTSFVTYPSERSRPTSREPMPMGRLSSSATTGARWSF